MKKKQYEKPSVEVVVLKQEPLMQASPAQAGVGAQNYEHWYDVPEE